MGQKYDQGATFLPRTVAADQHLQSLALADPQTMCRLRNTRAHTSKHMQQIRNSTPNNINSTKKSIKLFYTLQGSRERKSHRKWI